VKKNPSTNDGEAARIYRAGYLWLLAHGYTEWEAQVLSSLRLAFLCYPGAFM
jgi:hypothetical protein